MNSSALFLLKPHTRDLGGFSVRTARELRRTGAHLQGLQTWVALPKESELADPAFSHHPKATLPRISAPGVELRVVASSASRASRGTTSSSRSRRPEGKVNVRRAHEHLLFRSARHRCVIPHPFRFTSKITLHPLFLSRQSIWTSICSKSGR